MGAQVFRLDNINVTIISPYLLLNPYTTKLDL